MKKIILLSELFVPPYDEGMKVTALNLLKGIRHHADCVGLGPCEDENSLIKKVSINKFLYSRNLYNAIRIQRPDFVYYIPKASATFNSFIRFRILSFILKKTDIAMIALQNRNYSILIQKFIRMINPGTLFVTSNYMSNQFKRVNIETQLLPMGVDTKKFIPVSIEKKHELRDKYNIPHDKYIVLHVGHLKESRNIRVFLSLAKQPWIKAVIIGSTSTFQEEALKKELRQSGIIIIDKYVSENQEIYQLSDCYIFPVLERSGAMEFPLSILEAMACNLPIITTPFGSLPEYFRSSDDFHYFATIENLKTKLLNVRNVISKTREKGIKFSWENVAEQLLRMSGIM